MARYESQFRTNSTISCCHYCVAPKRHTACWSHCPEYLREKAEYEALKAELRKQEEINRGLYPRRYASGSGSRKGYK